MRNLALILLAGCATVHVAPFTAVRWNGSAPDVRVDGAWHRLSSVNGTPVERIVAFAKERYDHRWREVFELRLTDVLEDMGIARGSTVRLGLDGVEREIEMSPAHWQQVRAERDRPRRVSREHTREPRKEYAFLAERTPGEWSPVMLTRAQAEEDLDQLEWHLERRYSYLHLKGVDYRAALDTIRAGLGDGIDWGRFSVQLARLLALFGDGHTRLVAEWGLPVGYTPFLVGEGLVAFKADRSGFVDPRRPFLKSIDGVPIERWMEVAMRLCAGSDHFRHRRAVRRLRDVQYLRRELGLPETPTMRVELASASDSAVVELAVTREKPQYGEWPRARSRVLDGNIGYLRIPSMDNAEEHERALRGMLGTKALVIDVRGNGGGRRDALRLLFPYFMRVDDAPRVVNVASYRLDEQDDPREPEGFLRNRYLWPASSKVWSARERAEIARVAAGFAPDWKPGDGFSEWHYMVLSPKEGGAAYERPVVVLMDADCFSATDVFLGAFKGWRNVTLMGTTSGGGSGRAQDVGLRHSMVMLQLSSMASFRADGRLYDGRGVEPDVVVPPKPEDWIEGPDRVLEEALKALR